jgi:hypothetical protein
MAGRRRKEKRNHSLYSAVRSAIKIKRPRGVCEICHAEESVREAIEMLWSDGFRGWAIASALASVGIEVSRHAIDKHCVECVKGRRKKK